MLQASHRRRLAAVLLAALALRVGFVLAFELLPSLPIGGQAVASPASRTLFPDSEEYLRMAGHLLAGRGPMVSDDCRLGRMPGYAVFLAAVRLAFGPLPLAVRLVQALAAAAVVGLVAALARELFGTREALWAAALAAVYPPFTLYAGLVLSETLFMAFLLAGVLCLARAVRGERWLAALLAGAFFGLATLVRASFLHGVLLLAIGWMVVRRGRGRSVRGAACLLAAFAAMMAPWVAWTWHVSGHFLVTTTRAGASLYEALNPKADGGPMLNVVCEVPRPAGMDEVERDRQLGRLAVHWAASHPGRAAWLGLVKLGRFWNPVPNAREFRSLLFVEVIAVPTVLVLLAAMLGLRTLLKSAGGAERASLGEAALILLLPVVYYSLLHTVFVASIRYREAVMPLLVVLAARGLCAVWPRGRGVSRDAEVD